MGSAGSNRVDLAAISIIHKDAASGGRKESAEAHRWRENWQAQKMMRARLPFVRQRERTPLKIQCNWRAGGNFDQVSRGARDIHQIQQRTIGAVGWEPGKPRPAVWDNSP